MPKTVMYGCALQRLHWEPLLSMSTLLLTQARPPPELTPHFLPPQVKHAYMHACVCIFIQLNQLVAALIIRSSTAIRGREYIL